MSAEQLLNRNTNVKGILPMPEKIMLRPDVPFYPETDLKKEIIEFIIEENFTDKLSEHIFHTIVMLPESRNTFYDIVWDSQELRELSDPKYKHKKDWEVHSLNQTISMCASAKILDPDRFKKIKVEKTIKALEAWSHGYFWQLEQVRTVFPAIQGSKGNKVDALSRQLRIEGDASFLYTGVLNSLYPEEIESRNIDSQIWKEKGLRSLNELYASQNPGILTSVAYGMSLLSCERVEFGDFGMRLVWPEIKSVYQTPVPLPNERKF